MKQLVSIDRLVELFLPFWGALPPRFVYGAAKWGGLLWYAVDRRHREVAKTNIRLALGYDSEKKVEQLARANFIHLTTVFFETLGVARINPENCDDFVTVSGLECLLESLSKGRGLFTLTGHYGNWEWLAYVTPFYLKNRLNVVVRPLNSDSLNRVLTKLREHSGNRVIAKKKATGAIFRALQNNEMVGVLLDQVSSRGEGVYAPFFGVSVLTNRALASLAIKTGSPVHPIFIRRSQNGKYAIEIEPAINMPTNGSLRDRIFQATTLFNLSIEQQIRTDPTQWYWIHRRFKRYIRNPSDAAKVDRRMPNTGE